MGFISRVGGVVLGFGVLGSAGGCSGQSHGDGDSGDRAAKCTLSACGGDVVGTWNIESFCIDFGELPPLGDEPACRGALRDPSLDTTGTLTFGADGTYASNLVSSTTLVLVVTDACSRALNGANVTQAECDALQAEYASQPEEYSSAVCTFSPGSCSCTISTPSEASTESGTYASQGTRLVFSDGSENDYCVENDVLTLGVVVEDGSFTASARRAP